MTMARPYVRYLLVGAPLLTGVWATSLMGIPVLTTAAGALGGLVFLTIIMHQERLL